jgi:single-strand DNA-binding protein
MNKFIISGNLTKTPELKYSPSGKAYTKFSVAVKRPFKKDETDFFNATCFGKLAENVAQYTDTGSKVLVVGQVNIDKNGDKYYTNVIADEVEFLSSKQDKPQQQKPANDPFQDNSEPYSGDLPF